MRILKNVWNRYFIWHANHIKIPPFTPSSVNRISVTFSGKVQKVGFRLAVYCLAERMQLTGWVRNTEDGSVEAELQGEQLKIDYLLHCMQSLKRAKVQNMDVTNLPIHQEETNFRIVE